MHDFLATNPYEWENVLISVKTFIEEELKDIKSIRIVHRCETCFEKIMIKKLVKMRKKKSLMI